MKRLAVSFAAFLPAALLLSAWTDLPAWQYLALGLALGVWIAVDGRSERRDFRAAAAEVDHLRACLTYAREERDDARAQLRRAHIRLANRGEQWADLRVNGGRPQ